MVTGSLSHYTILDRLGAGGMGEVYLAEDRKLKRKVALKVLPEAMAKSPERIARFQREAEAVAALNHPGIVTIFSVEEAEGVHFLTMELVEGQLLAEVVPEGGLGRKPLIDIALGLTSALSAAHNKGITHRDLKPRNVIVRRDGHVKVLDFGLAKFIEASVPGDDEGLSDLPTRAKTEDGLVVGTVAYMSPEQAQGKDVDHRTDIFSLGIVLYETATGVRPFRGDTNIALISSVLKDTPTPVTELKRDLPSRLGQIIERCLQKDPERRYQSAKEVHGELEAVKREVDSSPSGAPSSLPPPTDEPGKSIAVLPFANLSPDPENEYFSDGLTDEIIGALSQLSELRVAARTSCFSFKGKSPEIGEVGDKLKVTTVLEGSVRKAGNRLRITAQLIDVMDGYQIWSERFDRTMDDVFAVQDEIASQIAEKLEVTFAGKTRQEPENVEAYDLYLKGRHFRLQWPGGLPRALECFEKAIAIDPKLALAHAGLADAYNYLGFYNYLPPKEAFPKARDAARQALAIDDSVADAYLHLAIVHLFHEWDFPSASREIRRALALEPNHPTAFIRRAFYLSFLGRHDEAVAAARRSLALDPLSPDGHHALHEALYLAHRFEETIEVCTATIELHPHSGVADRMMAAAYRGLELWEDALRWAEKAAELNPDQVYGSPHSWAWCTSGVAGPPMPEGYWRSSKNGRVIVGCRLLQSPCST